MEKEFTVPLRVIPGQSQLICNLDEFGQFLRNRLIVGKLTGEDGNIVSTVCIFADIERHLSFPEAVVSLSIEGDELVVETDYFARCVELTGENDGDPFGLYFSDNYFDLLPGEKKRVKIKTKHKEGIITAKAHYSKSKAVISYKAEN